MVLVFLYVTLKQFFQNSANESLKGFTGRKTTFNRLTYINDCSFKILLHSWIGALRFLPGGKGLGDIGQQVNEYEPALCLSG